MKPSFLIQQTKEYLYQEIEKLPGTMPVQLAVEMYELTLTLQPDKIVYDGDSHERPELAYSLGLMHNSKGAFYRSQNHDITNITGVDILHTERAYHDPMGVNNHGYVLCKHEMKNMKLVRKAHGYLLYCNRPN